MSEIDNYKNRIFCDLQTEYLIAVMLGRLLHIISNNNIINKKTSTLEVTMSLGKEITNKHILQCFNLYKLNNNNILSFYNWKLNNQDWIEKIEDNQFRFEVGQVLLNIMVELNLVINKVKILGREEKINILVHNL